MGGAVDGAVGKIITRYLKLILQQSNLIQAKKKTKCQLFYPWSGEAELWVA